MFERERDEQRHRQQRRMEKQQKDQEEYLRKQKVNHHLIVHTFSLDSKTMNNELFRCSKAFLSLNQAG